jgi:hypothetical protein
VAVLLPVMLLVIIMLVVVIVTDVALNPWSGTAISGLTFTPE